jgi:hypothetical protein
LFARAVRVRIGRADDGFALNGLGESNLGFFIGRSTVMMMTAGMMAMLGGLGVAEL